MTRAEISTGNLQAGEDVSGCTLLIAASTGFFSFAVSDANGQLRQFEKFTRNAGDAHFFNDLPAEGHWLSKTYKQVKSLYFSPHTILQPAKFHHPGSANDHLNLVYGDASESILLNDFIGSRSLYCLYRADKEMVRAVVRRFPLATAWHVLTPLLSQKHEPGGETLRIHFLHNCCCFVLQRNEQLLAARALAYTHVQNLAYQLLAFCRIHQVSPETVQLQAGGWITGGSPLHEELRKYFQQVEFANWPAAPAGMEQFPPHFFELFYLLQNL